MFCVVTLSYTIWTLFISIHYSNMRNLLYVIELNAIVADRLSRERGKYSDYEELKTAQFAAADEATIHSCAPVCRKTQKEQCLDELHEMTDNTF